MTLLETLAQRKAAVTVNELASLLQASRSKIYEMAKSGELPHIKIGDVIRFDPAAISEWIKKSTVRS